ncbi:MAG TPA: PorV/PorQ family protein [bacterium]|nr:PorV/PorQ family protein [bacterium]HMW35457.1 PorV/PorQ family protein [bacterium]HMZ03217.1 PorV/PorQ family protein [bacterium]HNB11092.1 PorV/PorQ family protein [bacterium]HNB55388.1 PorV/PorQ family protein [bacterium]
MTVRLILFFSLTISLHAGSGETGFAFLKINASARSSAMGEVSTYDGQDPMGVLVNPANLSVTPSHSVAFTYNRWIESTDYQAFSGKFKTGSWAWSLYYLYTGVDDIPQRDIPSEEPTAYFSSHDLAIGFVLSRALNDRWFAGIGTKYIYERIQNTVTAWAWDGGLYYVPNETWRAGFSFQNLGRSGKLIDERIRLPFQVRLSGGYTVYRQENRHRADLMADVIKTYGASPRLHTGSEYVFQEKVCIRLGYVWGYASRNISAGVGLIFQRRMRLDYAWTPFTNSLGSSHRISAGFDF